MATKEKEDIKQQNIYKKLLYVQSKLKAPKNQKNTFGDYMYRSCEDILESLKPILVDVDATVILSDSIEIFGDRYYVKATAIFIDSASTEKISNSAYAREVLEKKKSDPSQCTGSASSYARKYALNGLLLIDDTKDADTDQYVKSSHPDSRPAQDNSPINQSEMENLNKILRSHKWEVSVLLDYYKVEGLSQITKAQYQDFIKRTGGKTSDH